MHPHYKLASLDISKLYSKIPTDDTKTVLANALKHSRTDPQTQQELLLWYDIIITQKDSLAMGAPSSGLIADFFLQHTENTRLAILSHKHKIINYIRYMDDVLVSYVPHTPTSTISLQICT
jgi:hypothetical protein